MTALNLTPTVETLARPNYTAALKVIDARIPLSNEWALGFTLDELNMENLAEFALGTSTSYVLPLNLPVSAVTISTSLVKGYVYQTFTSAGVHLRSFTGVQVAGAPLTGQYQLLVEMGDGVAPALFGTAVPLVLGTSYTFDAARGFITILANGAAVTGRPLRWSYTLNATPGILAGNAYRVLGQTRSSWEMALFFVAENPANNDRLWNLQVHKTRMVPDGDLALIGDDLTTMAFTGTVERNTILGSIASPFFHFEGWDQV